MILARIISGPGRYEITVELPNGDWTCTIGQFDDVHDVLVAALDYAASKQARVHHIERIGD